VANLLALGEVSFKRYPVLALVFARDDALSVFG
jgi:hypothetical protein